MSLAAGSCIFELLSEVRAGDVLVMRRPEPISQLIRWMDDSDPDSPVDLSHSMLVLSAGSEAEGFSVWPLADKPGEIVSDVVIAPLQRLVRPYDRVIVLRHKELAALDKQSAHDRVVKVLSRARGFLNEGLSGAVSFDDKQLYAKALAYIEPALHGPREWLVQRVLRRLDKEIRDVGVQKVICPELIMRAFNEGEGSLPIRTSPVLPAAIEKAQYLFSEASPFDKDLSEVAWASFKREIQVAACAVAVEILVRSTLPRSRMGPADPDQMIEYTTPGDLQRSDDLVVIGAWEAWSGRIEDVRRLPGGRKAVRLERSAGPGAPLMDG